MRTEIIEKTRRAEKRSFQFADLLYLRADSKYVEAHHVNGMLVLDESLAALEREFGDKLLRTHRGVLIARDKPARLVKRDVDWLVEIDGADELVPVSRRYVAKVRSQLSEPA